MASQEQLPSFRPAPFPEAVLEIDRRPDGTLLLRNPATPDVEFDIIANEFAAIAARCSDKTAIAERGADGEWLKKSYAQFKADVDAASQWLLDQGAGPDTPIMIISGNSVAHASIRCAAFAIGAPVAPVSENYALLGGDGGYGRLTYALEQVKPHFVFAESASFSPAASVFDGETIIISREAHNYPEGTIDYQQLLDTPVTDDVRAAIDAIDPDAPAAYICTSGSTGSPKFVIQTNRMITFWKNQMLWALGASGAWGDVLVEWLPWSHVSGMHASISGLLTGSSFYIDNGKPLPDLFEQTIANVGEIQARQLVNVPAGYEMLATAMEQDSELRDRIFSNLKLLVFGGAGMSQTLFDRIQNLAIAASGERIIIVSGYGATETTSGCMSTYYPTERAGGIGLPCPGYGLKLIPYDDRYELRIKGVAITPGYLNRPELGSEVFDEEGFYRTGDTCTFVNIDRPEEGLNFAGRLSEEFKLNNGTWVKTGTVREDILRALAPHLFEVLVCGDNRQGIGILGWPNPTAGAPVIEKIAEKIKAYNRDNSALSRKIGRFALLTAFPDIDGGEMTDKGTVNQRLSQKLRSVDVERLFEDAPQDGVLYFD